MNADNARQVEVRMPEMGESIAEGTIVRWMKHEGDTIARDESIVEIETDKAVAELPSPAAGIVAKILVAEEETVPVGEVIALITPKDTAATRPAEEAEPSAAGPQEPATPAPESKTESRQEPSTRRTPAKASAVEREQPAKAETKPAGQERSYDPFASAASRDMAAPPTIDARPAAAEPSELAGGPVLSPVVSKLLAEHNLRPDEITGTGLGGRITKKDVVDHLARRGRRTPSTVTPEAKTREAPIEQESSTPAAKPATTRQPPSAKRMFLEAGPDDRVVPLEGIRAAIADHLTASAAIPRVTTVAEVDMSACVALRAEHRAAFDEHGLKLTYIPMILSAVCRAVPDYPGVNASLVERAITYYKRVHLGVSVARPQGLVVVVIRDAETKAIAQLTAELHDLAQRARDGKLKPAETRGSTLTVTNPGSLGGILSTPLINAPEAAIVSIQAIQKRPVGIGADTIAIRPMMYLAMSYDHRVIDGAEAIGYLQRVKQLLETPEFDFTIT